MKMKLKWEIIVSVQSFVVVCIAQNCIRTNSEGPKKFASCVFPFIYKNIVYLQCTNVTDPDGKIWCSTKVDGHGRHANGKNEWGYCDKSCRSYDDLKTTTTTSTTVAADPATLESTQLPLGNDCGFGTESGFIIGGEDAKKGAYPFVALLGHKFGDKIIYHCAGALINKRYVLTAAHCQRTDFPISEVILGEHDIEVDPECSQNKSECKYVQRFQITLADVTVHEGYNSADFKSNGDDIALIRLPHLVKTTDQDTTQNVLPICLARTSSIAFANEENVVVGWGRSSNDPQDQDRLEKLGYFKNTLQQLVVPDVPMDKCREYPSYKSISETKHICAGGEEGHGACIGDSGGPLIVRHKIGGKRQMFLRGIVSFGSRMCSNSQPEVYTNVAYYMDWIMKHLKP